MGYRGTDEYVYRLAGAACFGYAVMGIQELRSLHWYDMRLPNVMALVFNGLAFLARNVRKFWLPWVTWMLSQFLTRRMSPRLYACCVLIFTPKVLTIPRRMCRNAMW